MTTKTMSLQLLKDIVYNHAYAEVMWSDLQLVKENGENENEDAGMIVDAQTANMLLAVYNAFNKEESRKKFERMLSTYTNFQKLVDFGWKQVR
jgi:hypothetical protein